MYLLIDNYDSFTYNIEQYLRELTDEPIRVVRNDKITLAEMEELAAGKGPEGPLKGIILSPGPGRPGDAGICLAAVKAFAGRVPLLGVCLGHQTIAEALGGKVVSARRIVHGKAEPVSHDGQGLFRQIENPSLFTRYHSLAVEEESLPEELEITARTPDGEIMGLRHREFLVEGVQFHPESIASDQGKRLLGNFLHYKRKAFPVKGALQKVMAGEDLSREEAAEWMDELTSGLYSDALIAGFLTALNTKGITADEIVGCASVLRRKKQAVKTGKPVLDTCGTGGDGLGTFNISSMTALTAAACGTAVAKHGNRAVSSRSGSADFYRELGVPLDITPAQAEEMMRTQGFAFLFAPRYHGAMRFAGPARRALGVKTIMNLLGPLANPADAAYQMIGVYDGELCLPMARAARELGVTRVMTVYGLDGEDELSVTGPSRAVLIDEKGQEREWEITPEEAGVGRHTLEALAGGEAAENAALARQMVKGEGPAALRDAVLLNTAGALLAAGSAATLKEGADKARTALDRGAVKTLLERIQGGAP